MVLDTITLKVGDHMTENPVSVDSKTSLHDSIAIMAGKNIGNLIVDKDGVPSALLTEREIISHIIREGGIPEIPVGEAAVSRFEKVSPDDLVINAAKKMIVDKKRLLVFDENRLVGIITVTDMLRGLRSTGGNPSLEGVVRGRVKRCTYHDSIFTASKTMYSKKIGSILVSNAPEKQGIFTERDLLNRVITKGVDLMDRVGKYSSIPLITARLGIMGDEAAEIMSKNKIKRLPLTHDGTVKGIVTARDIVEAFSRP